MVKNIGNQPNQFGSINRIGTMENGRAVYQVTDGNGQPVGKMSIPQKDCDVFEKSYRDIIDAAPHLQKFAEKHSSEESVKKLKKTSNWILGLSTIGGACAGIFTTTKLKTWKQVAATLAGTVAGWIAGMGISYAVLSPKGASKFNKATKAISQLDIQPVIEG